MGKDREKCLVIHNAKRSALVFFQLFGVDFGYVFTF